MKSNRVLLLVLLALLAVAPALLPPFYVTLLNYVGLFSIVALGLVLLTGVAGLTSFGQAAFCGIGAYATAVLTTQFGLSPWRALIAALAITGFVALLIGAITLRLGGHYLPLATIAWGISLYYLFGTLPGLGQFTGIADLPALSLFGLPLKSERSYYYLIWAVTLASLLVTHNFLTSQPGRIVQALNGTASMAQAFGANTARIKMQVFLYAALLSCLSGWLYAHLQRYVNPSPFSVNAGIEYLFMAVIGGTGGVWGAVIGAAGRHQFHTAVADGDPADHAAGRHHKCCTAAHHAIAGDGGGLHHQHVGTGQIEAGEHMTRRHQQRDRLGSAGLQGEAAGVAAGRDDQIAAAADHARRRCAGGHHGNAAAGHRDPRGGPTGHHHQRLPAGNRHA